MVKKEQVEVSTSASAAAAAGQEMEEEGTSSSSGQPVQTITINGQQYQIVSPASLSESQLAGLQTVSVASSSGGSASGGGGGGGGAGAPVVQYAATSQNGQTVFIPNTVSAGSSATTAQV